MPVSPNQSSPLKIALVWTVALRILYSLVGVLAAPYLKLNPALIRSNSLTANLMPREAHLAYRLLGVWERFDTLWYVHISQHGYDRPRAVVFFPLYPLLIRLLSPFFSPLASALLISTVAAFFALWGFQKLFRLDLPEETVNRGLTIFALWPSAFILFAGYPESLLIALMIWAIYFARLERWWLAGLLGLLAGLTKAVGVFVFVPLMVIAWKQSASRERRISPQLLLSLLPLLSLPIFSAVVKHSGLPLAYDAYPKHWRTAIAFPLSTLLASLKEAFTVVDVVLWLNLAALAVIFVAVFARRIRPEYTLFSAAALVLFLIKKTDPLLQGTERYVLAVFPGFISLASVTKRPLLLALGLFVMCLLQFILLWSFFEWALVV